MPLVYSLLRGTSSWHASLPVIVFAILQIQLQSGNDLVLVYHIDRRVVRDRRLQCNVVCSTIRCVSVGSIIDIGCHESDILSLSNFAVDSSIGSSRESVQLKHQ